MMTLNKLIAICLVFSQVQLSLGDISVTGTQAPNNTVTMTGSVSPQGTGGSPATNNTSVMTGSVSPQGTGGSSATNTAVMTSGQGGTGSATASSTVTTPTGPPASVETTKGRAAPEEITTEQVMPMEHTEGPSVAGHAATVLPTGVTKLEGEGKPSIGNNEVTEGSPTISSTVAMAVTSTGTAEQASSTLVPVGGAYTDQSCSVSANGCSNSCQEPESTCCACDRCSNPDYKYNPNFCFCCPKGSQCCKAKMGQNPTCCPAGSVCNVTTNGQPTCSCAVSSIYTGPHQQSLMIPRTCSGLLNTNYTAGMPTGLTQSTTGTPATSGRNLENFAKPTAKEPVVSEESTGREVTTEESTERSHVTEIKLGAVSEEGGKSTGTNNNVVTATTTHSVSEESTKLAVVNNEATVMPTEGQKPEGSAMTNTAGNAVSTTSGPVSTVERTAESLAANNTVPMMKTGSSSPEQVNGANSTETTTGTIVSAESTTGPGTAVGGKTGSPVTNNTVTMSTGQVVSVKETSGQPSTVSPLPGSP